MVKSVRGAVSLERDDQEELVEKVGQLFSRLRQSNDFSEEDIVHLIFSQTRDISYNPAKALRLAHGLSSVPLFCAQEPVCRDFPQERMLRILVTFNSESKAKAVPVYLGEAAGLRDDLSGDSGALRPS